MSANKTGKLNKKLYAEVITRVFRRSYGVGKSRLPFARGDLLSEMASMGLDVSGAEKTIAKNIGEIIYSFRFRRDFPKEILATAPGCRGPMGSAA